MGDLEVARFFFIGGKRTCPNGMPAVQGCSCCLAPRGPVIVGSKRTCSYGIPIFLRSDVPQSSCDFVSWFLVGRGRNLEVAVSSLDSISPVFSGVEVLALT